jgi:hypothetical protein
VIGQDNSSSDKRTDFDPDADDDQGSAWLPDAAVLIVIILFGCFILAPCCYYWMASRLCDRNEEKQVTTHPAKNRARVRFAQVRHRFAFTQASAKAKKGKKGYRINRVQSRQFGQNGRLDSHISRNVVEIAEAYADQKKKVLAAQREDATQHHRDRLMERKRLMSANTMRRKRSVRQQPAVVHINTMDDVHRVQIEAHRYSARHAEKTKVRLEKSNSRLQDRLAARNQNVR